MRKRTIPGSSDSIGKDCEGKKEMLRPQELKEKSGCLDLLSLYGMSLDIHNVNLASLKSTQDMRGLCTLTEDKHLRKNMLCFLIPNSTVFILKSLLTFFLDHDKHPHKYMRLPLVLPSPICAT